MSRSIKKNTLTVRSAASQALRWGLSAAVLFASQLSTSEAQAQSEVDCRTLPNPVYMPATTLLQKMMDKAGPVFADASRIGAGNSMTIVYFPQPSCESYDNNINRKPLTGPATYYTATGEKKTCVVPAGQGVKADISAMDVGGLTCVDKLLVPYDMVEYPSYVETLGFVVPLSSSQVAITASEGYYLMKDAGRPRYQVPPWTDPKHIHVRNPGSSTQLTVGSNIGVPGTRWNPALQGNRGSSAVRDTVAAANNTAVAEKTIGILNSSKWEAKTDSMKVLAFEPYHGCQGAFFPDSTRQARDKINVRDGHYPIWTNLRFVVREYFDGRIKTPNGEAAGRRTRKFVDLMTGNALNSGLPLSQFVIESGNIPNCAMYVKRERDGGPLLSFAHPTPCHCAFLAGNGVNAPECSSCDTDSDCSGSRKCRNNFCEER